MPALRRLLVGTGMVLAGVAVLSSGLQAWLSVVACLGVIALGSSALRGAPVQPRLRMPQPGLVIVEAESLSGPWQGRLEPLYTSGFYCAFRVADPARGKRVFGLFRDELDSASWRRLQVALRAA